MNKLASLCPFPPSPFRAEKNSGGGREDILEIFTPLYNALYFKELHASFTMLHIDPNRRDILK